MTTKFKMTVSEDLFVDNESLILNEALLGPEKDNFREIGAITLCSVETELPREATKLDDRNVLEASKLIASSTLKNWTVYLFIADGGWLNDTKIIRHKKLWKRIPTDWELNNFPVRSDEVAISKEGMIRYAGVVAVPLDMFAHAVSVVRSSPSSVLFVSERPDFMDKENIEEIFRSSFSNNKEDYIVNWTSISASSSINGDFVLRVSGEYDDQETAIDFISKTSLVKKVSEKTFK